MNKVILQGNLTRDPEVKVVGTGEKQTTLTKFTMAMSEYRKGGNKDTTFMSCEAWGRSAENLGKFVSKGSPLLIEGALQNDNWEKDGQKFSRVVVRVLNFDLIGSRPANKTTESNPPSEEAPAATTTEPPVDDSKSPF